MMEDKKKIVEEVIGYVEARLSLEEGLDLEKIADNAGYSKFHLNRVFSEVTGCTLHRYVRERRLTEAARKLVQEKASIADIAWEAAYQSQQAFTLAFKQAYGCTPHTYRKAGIHKELRAREIVQKQAGLWRCAA
ncbi:helix-turn-helix transcriptional regulator [Clostridium sp. Marseille-P2415]|uniref:helix-turn-helix transcriptional regulator n=1 Tax=Clostridium sp. Marseille-P2415 TaxID=1805471 RepID=UPI0013567206|nr:helix-turn-helix transcriptional regulator [Clostridium sp. Marseille-P2415]